MFWAAIVAALFPLIIHLTDAGDTPFVFATIFGFCQSAGIYYYIKVKYPEFHSEKIKAVFWSFVKGKYASRHNMPKYLKLWDKYPFLFILIGRFGILFYAWSTGFVNTAIAEVFFASSVIWFVLLRKVDQKSSTEMNKSLFFGNQTFGILFFALPGLLLVIISETGRFDNAFNLGILFASISGFLDAINIERSIKLGENSVTHLKECEVIKQ